MFHVPARDQAQADRHRLSRQMLADIRERRKESWGWVVYRTTYKSDAAFSRAINVINSWIKQEVYDDLRYSGVKDPDPTPNNELWACHQLTIMDDPQTLDGASIEDVRSHFESWVEGQGQRDRWNKYRVCMVIDDEILQLLNEVPTAEQHAEMHGRCGKEIKKWYVKVVEAFPDPDEAEGIEGWEGWMYCSIYALVRLWGIMGDATYMVHFFCDNEEGVFSS
ncbi:hypothetical protein CNMCM5793_006896 [Aspergillus hiratsukae]|uniref:Uncharacterized protein n=1 Tax=Aspergillus hiratsukae TaxID=1194566 RepID=A0A8H6UK91_9EURO|nr:hypothetical protein CNMCM5793_006896 [Aspergillus hiratsukae]